MAPDRAQTWHVSTAGQHNKRSQKRPFRPSIGEGNGDKWSKKSNSEDGFIVKGSGSTIISSRDPRRRQSGASKGPQAGDCVSVVAGREETAQQHDNQASALQTPPVSTESEVFQKRNEEQRLPEQVNGYPLSPRSKSPDDETKRRAEPQGRREPESGKAKGEHVHDGAGLWPNPLMIWR